MPLPPASICLVTGATGTIGFAIAQALMEEGQAHKIFLTGRSLDKLHACAQQLLDTSTNPTVHRAVLRCLPCDVTNEKAVEGLFKAMDKEGKITLLINNAGVNAPPLKTTEMPAADFRHVMDTNVVGPFLCAREGMKRMKNNGVGGRIINIGSLSAVSPRPESAPYTASKFALLGLTQSLALDGRRHNIAVSIIHPGNVDSDLLTPEMKQGRSHEGFLPAKQVAKAVLNMAQLPYDINILETTILPTKQPFVGRG